MKKSTSPKWARNQSELAKLLGTTRRSISTWLREPGNPGTKADGRYDVAEWQTWCAVNDKKTVSEDEPTLTQQKLKLIAQQTRKLTLQNAILNKEYRSVVEIEAWLGEMIGTAKRVLNSGPASLAPRVVGETIPEAEKMMREWLHEALSKLSGKV